VLKPNSNAINVFEEDFSKKNSFFTGSLDLQNLKFDPFVTGYAFIIWVKVPTWVDKAYPSFRQMTQNNFKSFDGLSDISLNSATYAHSFNGNEYNFASNITKENTEFTLKHQEYSGSPIKNMYQYWVTGIRDPLTNIATYPTLAEGENLKYAAKNHTGSLLYIVTRPDANNVTGKNIEFAAYYTGVYPTKIPLSHLNYSQNDNNGVEIDMPFKGNMYISPKVDEYAQSKLSEIFTFELEEDFTPLEYKNSTSSSGTTSA